MRVFHFQIMTVLTPMQMGAFLFMIAKYFRLVYPADYKSLTKKITDIPICYFT